MEDRRRNEFVLSFHCCSDRLLILPVFTLSQRPYHTPVNMSVAISQHCLDLDRSPSTVCCLNAGVCCRLKLLLSCFFSPLFYFPLRLQPFPPPSDLKRGTCRFPVRNTQAFFQALPQHQAGAARSSLLPQAAAQGWTCHSTAAHQSCCCCAPWGFRVLGD